MWPEAASSLTAGPAPSRQVTMSLADTGPRFRRLPRAERRELLLDEAARLAIEGGIDAVTMERVGESAGATRTLAYAYFANRHELLVALLEREMGRLAARVDDRMRTAGDAEGVVRAAVGAWFDLAEASGPLLAALVQTSSIRPDIDERRDSLLREQEAFWSRLVSVGYGIPYERAQAAAAVLLAGLGGALVRWSTSGGDRTAYEDVYVDIVFGTIDRLRARGDATG